MKRKSKILNFDLLKIKRKTARSDSDIKEWPFRCTLNDKVFPGGVVWVEGAKRKTNDSIYEEKCRRIAKISYRVFIIEFKDGSQIECDERWLEER